jgi:N-acetylglucosamine-6-sulfatase
MEGVHQADYLGQAAVERMVEAQSEGRPFFLHLAPTMAHFGTCDGPHLDLSLYADTDPFWEVDLALRHGCPNASANQGCKLAMSPCATSRSEGAAGGRPNPHTPAWNVTASGPTPLEMARPPLTDFEAARQDFGFRNRTASIVDLDDMLGVVLDGLKTLGLEENTIVVVTSDNGFHLGAHRLPMGKEHPLDTDVRIPFYARGPGIAANTTLLHPITLVDLTATIVELAGARGSVGPQGGGPLDGLSFAGALLGGDPDPSLWRNFSFSEHFDGHNSWVHVRYPLLTLDRGGMGTTTTPPVNLSHTTFTRWCTNQSEVYDLGADPFQLQNLAGSPGRGSDVERVTLPLALALLACKGAAECASQSAQPSNASAPGVPCYKTTH